MDSESARALFSAFIVVASMLLVGFPVHEYMHAWAAYRQGDNTARWQGRLTLDPRVHFDRMGGSILAVTAIFSAFGGGILFGWARPTPVNPMNLVNGRRSEALVAFAGPLSNLVIAAIVAIPMRIILANEDLRRYFLFESDLARLFFDVGWLLLGLNILLFIFNLIPVPPLDGWRVLTGIVPTNTYYQLRELEQRYANIIPMIFMGLILIIFISGAGFLGAIIGGLRNLLLGI
ncbi:MAG: site-2 protease family protein [Chloroflexota bacterium]